MKRSIYVLLTMSSIMCMLACAGTSQSERRTCNQQKTEDEILESMRQDTMWIHQLDSLAQIHIGAGAVCLDAVKHTFRWDGRLWVYNNDWGGVLEIPEGFIPSDDKVQTELTYHGAGIFSADSLVYISHYEGYQGYSYDEYLQVISSTFRKDSLITKTVMSEGTVSYGNGMKSPVLIFETLNRYGIKGYFRYIYTSPGGTEYVASIQYPENLESRYGHIRVMIDAYPFGPSGEDPRMEQ